MRIVCPHVGDPHPDTREALDRWPLVEYVDLTDDPDYGYGKLLRRLWSGGETFAIVEHDVVPHAWTLLEFATCERPYCASPYRWQQAVGVALGCTKFSSLLIRAYPDAAEIACRLPSNYGRPGHWRQLDMWLQAAVLRDLHGVQPHCHLPPVGHRNWVDTPAGAPLRTRVEGPCYLDEGLVGRIADEVRGQGL